jgi:membrane-associated phospholipid phosphatase
MNKLAQIISYIFHPLLMPLYGLLIIFQTDFMMILFPLAAKKVLIYIVCLGMIVLPIAFISLFYYNKMVGSLLLKERRERVVPLAITALVYFATYYIMHRLPISPVLIGFFLGSAIAVLLNFIIVTRWKISSHTIGVGGLLALCIIIAIFNPGTSLIWLMSVALVCGLVGTSRLQLEAHSPAEVYSGYLLGFISISGSIILYF